MATLVKIAGGESGAQSSDIIYDNDLELAARIVNVSPVSGTDAALTLANPIIPVGVTISVDQGDGTFKLKIGTGAHYNATTFNVNTAGATDGFNTTAFTVSLAVNNTGVPNGETIPIGYSLSLLNKRMLRKGIPYAYQMPTLTLSGAPAPITTEVGTTITPTLTPVFIQHDAGTPSAPTMTKNGVNFPAVSGVFSDSIVLSLTPIAYLANVAYAQGPLNNDSLGDPSPTGRIGANNINSSSAVAYVGTYYIFYGPVTAFPTNSAQVRAMANQRFTNAGNVFIMNTGTTQTKFAVWIPPSKTLVSIIDLDALNLDITSLFANVSVTANDAAGAPVAGHDYEYSQSVPYGTSHRFQITLS